VSLEAIVADTRELREPKASGEIGECLECHGRMIGRVGLILAPHWAHTDDTACEYRTEAHEGYWHKAWKHRLKTRGWQVEQTRIGSDGKRHRADCVSPQGTVVELQNEYQDPREIIEREKAYKHMLWMLRGTLLLRSFKWATEFEDAPDQWRSGDMIVHEGSARSLTYMRRPVLIDTATLRTGAGERHMGGIFYVGYWDINPSRGGRVSAQSIYRGADPEEAADVLHDWFGYLRWAA
jgi:hypothetical protein